jgi:Cdc6-like AAA superfamily ATPase
MGSILSGMGQVIHGRESASDLVKRFQSLGKKMIVCLDESDHLKDLDVLYVLARNSCAVVLISNMNSSLAKSDPRIRSSLLLSEIEFKPYSREEILAIMKERLRCGMRVDAIEPWLLALVSKACRGDARVALQTLKIAAREAESKGLERITVDEVRSALRCSRKYRLSYLMRQLNEHQRTIYEVLRKHGRLGSGKLFTDYCTATANPVVDRSYRMLMERMVEMGLVRSIGSGRWKEYELA